MCFFSHVTQFRLPGNNSAQIRPPPYKNKVVFVSWFLHSMLHISTQHYRSLKGACISSNALSNSCSRNKSNSIKYHIGIIHFYRCNLPLILHSKISCTSQSARFKKQFGLRKNEELKNCSGELQRKFATYNT